MASTTRSRYPGSLSHMGLFARSWLLIAFPLFARLPHVQTASETNIEKVSMFNTTHPINLDLSTRFHGFSVTYDIHQPGANQFTVESVALAAIGAMKEEALLDYSARLLDFDYTDDVDLDNPVRISGQAVLGAPAARTTRSIVLWSLRTLAVQMMRRGILRPLPFNVWYRQVPLYTGELREREVLLSSRNSTDSHNNTTVSARRALSPATSLDMVSPTPNSTTIILQDHSTPSQPQDPAYEVNFQLTGIILSPIGIFESLLILLLRLAESDASAELPRCCISHNNLQALVFMMEVGLYVEGSHPFHQFQAVAIAQAIARYYVMQGEYTELTFDFRVNGVVVARGCVTTTWNSRRWCQGLIPDDEFRNPIAATS